ncbi:MAG: biotin/lipoyl-binding protein, partial [Thermodesulfovibrionales bacterium]|nr:biotin/lipoyl-binding protein [Thermodesulfovibrionales bacterium]
MSKDAKKNQDIKDVLEINRSYLSRKNLKLYLAIGFVFIILFSFIFFLKTKNSNAIQYKTEKVKRGDLTVIVTATGTLQPKKTVTVGSELSGIIKSVEVNYNDRVKVGQILAKLDTSKLEAQLTQVKAELEVAKAKVMQAKATLLEAESKLNQLKKARELSNGKVPSQIEMD